jgi:hypothetical protein
MLSNWKYNYNSTTMELLRNIVLSFLMAGVLSTSAAAQIERIVDLDDVNGKNYGFTIEGETAGDHFGRGTLFADINGDGFDDLLMNANNRQDGGTAVGAVYVIFGSADLPTSTPDFSDLDGTNGFILFGEFDGGSFGSRMASGDINGDDIEDVIFADPQASPFGRPSTAAAYVLFGQSTWSDTLRVADFDGSDGFRIYGGRYEDPEYVASGDLNDDGFDEVIIGSDYSHDPDQFAGRTTILYGKSSGFPDQISTLESEYGSYGAKFKGTTTYDRFGHGLATGDFNSDGKTDLIASAPYYHRNFQEKGRIYVVLGNDSTFSGTTTITGITDETNGFILSESSYGCCHYAGQEVKTGDTNGDGFDDIIIGTPNFYHSSSIGRAGRVVVYRGNVSTTNESFGKTGGASYASINGITEDDKTGHALEVVDINLDGNEDILIGAYNAKLDGTNRTGAVYVVYGPVLTDIDLEDLTEDQGFVLKGESLSRAGINISTGDMNNDGIPEIAIGSQLNSPNGAQSGEVILITNMASQTITGSEGFRMLSSPAKGTVYSNMLGDFWTQGFTNSDGGTEADPNFWTWDWENQEWDSLANQDTDVYSQANGFLMYVFDDEDLDGTEDGFPKEIRSQGTLFSTLDGAVEPNDTTLTAVSGLGEDHYFLFGNPYTFPIDWDAPSGWTKTNLNNVIQNWSDSVGIWYAYNGLTGNKPDSGLIAPFEAVFVQAGTGSGTATLSLNPDTKSDASVTQLKSSTRSTYSTLKIRIENSDYYGEANLVFHQHGKFGRDNYDADALIPLSNQYVQVAFFESGNLYSIGSLPDEEMHDEVFPLHLEAVNTSANAQLSIQLNNFDESSTIELLDVETGDVTELTNELNVPIQLNAVSQKISRKLKLIKPTPVLNRRKSISKRYNLRISRSAVVSNENESEEHPLSFELKQNYPNPFNPTTNISFSLPESGEVSLDVFDVMGRHIANLVKGTLQEGNHTMVFNAEAIATGVYIYRLKTGGDEFFKKMMFIK